MTGEIDMNLVESIVRDWKVQRPDINCSAKPAMCRLLAVQLRYLSLLEAQLKPLGIAPHVFSVLVTIRRRGPSAEVNVKTIRQEVLVTSGGMSNLLTRLITKGWISKRPDSDDARSMRIKLTPKGRKLVDTAMEIQAACEHTLMKSLNRHEHKQLESLLQKMLEVEPEYVTT